MNERNELKMAVVWTGVLNNWLTGCFCSAASVSRVYVCACCMQYETSEEYCMSFECFPKIGLGKNTAACTSIVPSPTLPVHRDLTCDKGSR